MSEGLSGIFRNFTRRILRERPRATEYQESPESPDYTPLLQEPPENQDILSYAFDKVKDMQRLTYMDNERLVLRKLSEKSLMIQRVTVKQLERDILLEEVLESKEILLADGFLKFTCQSPESQMNLIYKIDDNGRAIVEDGQTTDVCYRRTLQENDMVDFRGSVFAAVGKPKFFAWREGSRGYDYFDVDVTDTDIILSSNSNNKDQRKILLTFPREFDCKQMIDTLITL